MRAEMLVIEQARFQGGAAAGEAESGKDHEGDSWQQGKEGADRAETERRKTCPEI
jgi:hypothetical protein